MEVRVFFDREKEKRELRAILSGEPNVVWFVYGPINSGKTALINKVIEELPEDYRVFYINFRGFEGGYRKFTRVMFKVGDDGLWRRLRERLDVISAGVEYVERVAQKINTGIVLPSEFIRRLQVGDTEEDKVDLFNYLEELMKGFRKKNLKPVLIFDELQVIKEEINATGKPLLTRLFNFLVRMTKETHLCHSLCATSDCLFMEDIWENARLEGRVKGFLVDDLSKDGAYQMYEGLGLKEKELLWEYVGGKPGDIIGVYEEVKRGLSEKEAVERVYMFEKNRVKWIVKRVKEGEDRRIEYDELIEGLKVFRDREVETGSSLKGRVLRYLVDENLLFYDPITDLLKPQSRLILRAIREIV